MSTPSKAQLRILRSMHGGNVLRELTPQMKDILVTSGWIQARAMTDHFNLYILTAAGLALATAHLGNDK